MDEISVQLRTAILEGRTDIVNMILQPGNTKLGTEGLSVRDKILTEQILPEGTFFHFAAKLGAQDIVRSFLFAGADVLQENKDGENPYEVNPELQQIFVEELLRATASSNINRIDQLLKAGLDPNSWDCDQRRNSVLHWAVSFANRETINFLIEHGADVNLETADRVVPLHDAVERGDLEIVETLLKHNASPLVKSVAGKFADKSPLDLASQNSQKPEIFSLISHYLAAQFKTKTKRPSMESIYTNGPESPCSPSALDLHPSSSGDYFHKGFNSTLENVLRAAELKAPIQPLITDSSLNLLWPLPKRLHQLDGPPFRPEKTLHVCIIRTTESVHRILDLFSMHKDVFEDLGYDIIAQQVEGPEEGASAYNSKNNSSQIQCCISSDILSVPQSYRLHITSQKVKITASDVQGCRNGICTLLQLLTLYSSEKNGIPPLTINDWPSLPHRGVLVDLHQRIPTIETLFDLIKLHSLLKINFVHLHFRMDKSGNLVSYTKGEIVAIDRHCLDLGINLVPTVDVVAGITVTEYFQFIKPQLLTLLPNFASTRYIHVGPELTSLIFSNGEMDKIDFNNIWNFLPIPSADSIVMLCYNALKVHVINPASLVNVPTNVILIDYGFQADYNFGCIQDLFHNGITTACCVGTCAWSSLAGNPEASLCNIYNGTMSAVNNSSVGLICSNWSGTCTLTSMIFAWPGFLLASGLAWNHETHWEYLQGSLASLMSTYILKDSSSVTEQLILQLGVTETNILRAALNQAPNDLTNLPPSEGSILFRLLTDPDSVELGNLTMEPFIKCIRSIKKCQTAFLLDSKISRENNPVFDELCLTMELMLLACRIGRALLHAGLNPRSNMGLNVVNLGIANLEARSRTDIANKLLLLIDEYRRVWLLKNFPHGLESSLYTLTAVLQRFIPDSSRILAGPLISTPYRHEKSLLRNGSVISHDT